MLFCLQDKGVAWSIIENFRFQNEYNDEYGKCLSYSGLCMLNGCSVLVARKLLQSVTNEPDELKFNTLRYRQVCTECSSSCSRCHQSQIFISLCCEITTRLPDLVGQSH